MDEDIDSKLPLQLAIVGRPNVGKSTLLNAILQENRVLVGPEAGLTRDSIRVQFQYEGRNVYLVSVNIIVCSCGFLICIGDVYVLFSKINPNVYVHSNKLS